MATAGQLSWQQLVAIARRVGVKVIEAPSSHRGKLGKMGSVVGVTAHTTGTPNTLRPADDYPDYNVVKEGRTGLLNSLSAYGIGRREAIIVFSEFLSWHAGLWNWKGITDGNGHFLGIECAGVGDYTPFQRAVYPRLVAAILLEIGSGSDMAPRHKDGAMPRGRKPDAQNFDGDWLLGASFYQWVDFFMANPAHININYVAPASPVAPPAPTLEDIDMLVEIEPGDTRKIPVPSGRKWKINVVSDAVFGQNVYGKQVSPGRAVGLFFGNPLGVGEKEWELFVGETHNVEIPCSATSFIEITNKGRDKVDESRSVAVTLTPA